MAAPNWKTYDTNGDGKLTDTELTTWDNVVRAYRNYVDSNFENTYEADIAASTETSGGTSSGGSSGFNSAAYTDMLVGAGLSAPSGLTSNPQPIPNAEYNPQSLEDAWDDIKPPSDVELSGAYKYSQTLFRDLVDQYRGGVRENDHGNPNPMLRIIPRLYDGNYTVAEAIGILFSGSPSDLSPEAVAAARENYLELSDQQISAISKTFGFPEDTVQDQILQQNALIDPERAANDGNQYSQWAPETPIGRFLNDLQGDVDELFKDAPETDIKAQAAKKGLNAMLQTAEEYYESDYMQTSQAVLLKAAGGLMETAAGAVALMGSNPEDTSLYKLGSELAALGNDTYDADFKESLKDIEQRIGEAKGFEDSAKAIFGALADHPTEFLIDYVGVEMAQEIPLLIASGGTASAARGALALKGVAQEVAERIASKAGFGTGVTLDLAEAGFGAAGGAYEQALDSLLFEEEINKQTGRAYTQEEAEAVKQMLVDEGRVNKETGKPYTQEEAEEVQKLLLRKSPINKETGKAYTQEEAEDAAQTVAIKAGTTGALLAAGGMFFGGNALEDYLRKSGKSASDAVGSGVATAEDFFDDFISDISGAVFENAPKNVKETISTYLGEAVNRVGEITEVFLKEGFTELIEETGVTAVVENALYELGDISRDAVGNMTKSGMLAFLIGGPTSAGIAAADFVTNALINANPQINKVKLDADVAIEGGADPLGIAEGLKEALTSLGVDQPRIQNNIVNEVYDAGYLTETEVVNAAGALGVDLLPAQIEALAGDSNELEHMADLIAEVGKNIYGAPSDVEFDVNGDGVLTGQELTERDQAMEAWEAENPDFEQLDLGNIAELDTDGVTGLSEDEFTAYVNLVGGAVDLRSKEIDATRLMFNNLGYNPTPQEVINYKDNKADIPDYIDPRQLTREELEAVAAAEGYALKDSDYNRVGQGGADFEAVESGKAITTFDPLALSTQEIKDAAAAEGFILSNAEAEALAGNITAGTTEAEALKIEQDKFDAGAISAQEVIDAAAAEGYTLSEGEAEAAARVLRPGSNEAEEIASLRDDFNSRAITAAELEAIAAAEGYTLTDEDKKLIGNVAENTTDSTVLGERKDAFDDLIITAAELEAVAAAEGYTLTDEDRKLIGAVGEGESAADILGQRGTTFATNVSDANAAAARQGYDDTIRTYISENNGTFTEAEIQAFVDQAVAAGSSSGAVSSIGNAINTATQAALDAAEAAANRTDSGTDDGETTDGGTGVGEVSTADQIREILRAEGIETFDDAAINTLAGLVDAETLSIDDITKNEYEDFIDAFENRGTQGPDIDDGAVDPFVSYLNGLFEQFGVDTNTWPEGNSIGSLQGPNGPIDANGDGIYSPDELIAAGLTEEMGFNPDLFKTPTDDAAATDGAAGTDTSVDEGPSTSDRVKAALAAIGAENLIPALVDKLIQDVVSGTVDIADVAEEYKTLAAANQGDADASTGDQGAGTNTDNDTDLSDQVDLENTTISGDSDDYVRVGDFNREVGTLEDNIVKLINQLEANGVDRDDAIAAAVGVPAGQEGGPSGLYAELGKFATVNQVDALKKVVDGIAGKLGTTATDIANIKNKMVDLVTKADIAGLATKEDLQTLLTTEDIADLATEQDVLDAEGRLKDRIDALQAEGKTRFDAIDIALGELATEVGSTQEAVTKTLAKFQLELNADIAELATKKQVAAVEANILARIKSYEDQGYSRDVAIQKSLDDANANIDTLATDLDLTKETITKQLTDFQTKLEADLSLLATKKQVNDLETELYLKIAEYEAQAISRDEATKLAIADLATDLETTEDNLMTQLGVTQDTLTDRINEVETNLENQFNEQIKTTQDLITDTATDTQKQIKTAANQSAARDFFDMVLGSEDLEGQQVTVSQSPLAQINYIYDFQDPLANQQQRGFFGAASPYGESLAAGKSRRPQTIANVMQGPLNLQGAPVGPMGMAAGGKVDYDFLNEISQIMSFGE